MALDELIAQERKIAEHYHKMYEYECFRYGKKTVDSGVKLDCVKQYEYHSQLMELLEELNKRRSEDYGYMADIHQSIGYRKAIDAFVTNVKDALITDYSVFNTDDIRIFIDIIEEIAEQLKAGGENEI